MKLREFLDASLTTVFISFDEPDQEFRPYIIINKYTNPYDVLGDEILDLEVTAFNAYGNKILVYVESF